MAGKKIKSEEARTLSPVFQEELLRFIEYHPAGRFGKNLRNMLIEFLQYDGAIEAGYLNNLLYNLEGLFALLDVIEAEGNQNRQRAK